MTEEIAETIEAAPFWAGPTKHLPTNNETSSDISSLPTSSDYVLVENG